MSTAPVAKAETPVDNDSDGVAAELKAQVAELERQLERSRLDNQAKDRTIASLQQQLEQQLQTQNLSPLPAALIEPVALQPLSPKPPNSTYDATLAPKAKETSSPVVALDAQLGKFLQNKVFNNEQGLSLVQSNIDSQLQKFMQDRLVGTKVQEELDQTAQNNTELDLMDHDDDGGDDSSSVSSTHTDSSNDTTRSDSEISSSYSEASATFIFGNLQRQSLERIQHQKMMELAVVPVPQKRAPVLVSTTEMEASASTAASATNNESASVDDVVGQIQRWLFLKGGNLRDVPSLLSQYCNFCRSFCNMTHLDRLVIAGMMLPPKVSAHVWQWESGKHNVDDGVSETEVEHLDESFAGLIEGQTMQVRIQAGSNHAIPAGCTWFAEGNYFDYLALPIYHNGEFAGAMTWATKNPKGFSEKDIQIFHESLAALSTVLRLHTNDMNMKALQQRLMDDVKNQTEDLAKANHRLVANNKRVMKQAQDQLKHFAMMSHEIRTPLNCIVGLSNLLLENPENPLDPQVEESLTMITASGDLLLAVVDDVLDYSKLSTGNVEIEMAPMDIRKIVRTVVESVRIKAASVSKENPLQFRTDISEALPKWVDLDGRRLQQILYNLLGNAIKFGKLGKYVDFSIKVIHDESKDSKDKSCATTATSNTFGSYMLFAIKDYGTGIDDQEMKTIFQPFQQSASNDPVDGGTGLGLAITSQLCKVLGGDVSVSSEKGKWAEFVVKLPLIRSSNIPEAPESPTAACIEEMERTLMRRSKLTKSMSQRLRASLQGSAAFEDLDAPNLEDPSVSVENLPDRSADHTEESKNNKPRPKTSQGDPAPSSTIKSDAGSQPNSSAHSVAETKTLQEPASTAAPTTKAPPTSEPKETTEPFANLRVLIAEDNLINQKVLNRTLMRLGMKNVDIVENGQEAVNKSAENVYDIVFMDWCMPVMDGLEATKRIVARRQEKPGQVHPCILFLTAHALEDYREKAAQAGGDGFISKPFKLAAIKEFLDKQGLGETT
ncbi:MAG: hypothetical protein SGILL_002808 [Bacillariaceae sp.]